MSHFVLLPQNQAKYAWSGCLDLFRLNWMKIIVHAHNHSSHTHTASPYCYFHISKNEINVIRIIVPLIYYFHMDILYLLLLCISILMKEETRNGYVAITQMGDHRGSWFYTRCVCTGNLNGELSNYSVHSFKCVRMWLLRTERDGGAFSNCFWLVHSFSLSFNASCYRRYRYETTRTSIR